MLEDGGLDGRIFLMPIGPRGRPWMWASGHKRAIERAVHGYEPTRLRWRRSLRAGDENWPASAPGCPYNKRIRGPASPRTNQMARLEGVVSGWAGYRNHEAPQAHVVEATANNGPTTRCRACNERAAGRASSAWQSGNERSRARSALSPASR